MLMGAQKASNRLGLGNWSPKTKKSLKESPSLVFVGVHLCETLQDAVYALPTNQVRFWITIGCLRCYHKPNPNLRDILIAVVFPLPYSWFTLAAGNYNGRKLGVSLSLVMGCLRVQMALVNVEGVSPFHWQPTECIPSCYVNAMLIALAMGCWIA